MYEYGRSLGWKLSGHEVDQPGKQALGGLTAYAVDVLHLFFVGRHTSYRQRGIWRNYESVAPSHPFIYEP